MALRNYANAPATTLTASCSSGATTISVASTSGLPVSYPYILILDRGTASEEVVLVTAAAGLVLTVTRGYDSTTAFAHANGAEAVHGISAIDPREANIHVNANSGVHGVTGSVVGTTDAQTVTNKTIGSTNVINGFTASKFMVADGTGRLASGTKDIPSGVVVGHSDVQSLTNKTISADVNTINGVAASSFVLSNASGEVDGAAPQKVIPNGAVVGTTDTQTLTNKTLTSPTINNGTGTFTSLSTSGLVLTNAIINLAATVTPGSGWTVNVCDVLYVDSLVFMNIRATYSGATLTGSAVGNIGDSTVFTALPATYRPTTNSVYALYQRDGQTFGNCVITNAGAMSLQTLHATATISSGDVIATTIVYTKLF